MKKILITPLDWGLGHATRCIPIIQNLIQRGHTILLGGSGESLELLQKEFPSLQTFILPSYAPRYPKSAYGMAAKMIFQLPKFVRTISKEHATIEEIIRKEHIDLVISDNRYGCWSSQITSVFITHQSNILMPKRFGWLAGLVRSKNESLIRKFSRCWIPDFPKEQSLAGDLISFGNFKTKISIDYIGALSRFANPNVNQEQPSAYKYKCLAVCSGPEPQRTLFENILTRQLEGSQLSYFIVRGKISRSSNVNENYADYLTTNDLKNKILESEFIIARSGYSTIMDLSALHKKAIFIPTPGQTEQEYLAKKLKQSGIANYQMQDTFSLAQALADADKFSGFVNSNTGYQLLDQALNKVLG
jgi:uncharacterized protein (TIGR00661 family)